MNEKSRKAVDFIYYHANALLIAAGIAVIIFFRDYAEHGGKRIASSIGTG